jgi:hypothetical protein
MEIRQPDSNAIVRALILNQHGQRIQIGVRDASSVEVLQGQEQRIYELHNVALIRPGSPESLERAEASVRIKNQVAPSVAIPIQIKSALHHRMCKEAQHSELVLHTELR